MSDNNWPVPQRPMSLGEIYLSSLRLMARTAARGLTLSFVVLVPLYILFGRAARGFFLAASRILGMQDAAAGAVSEEVQASVYTQVAGEGLSLLFVVLGIVIASTLVQLALTVESWDRALLTDRSISGWLERVAGRPMAMTFAQIILLALFLAMIGCVTLLIGAMLTGAAGPAGFSMALFGGAAVSFYLALKVAFRLHEIVADDRGPWRSLVSSAVLVRGRWFKVFTTLFPVTVLLVVLSELASQALGGSVDTSSIQSVDPTDFQALAKGYRELASGFTMGQSIALGIISALGHFLLINLLTALYVDLRARRGDFDYEEGEVAV